MHADIIHLSEKYSESRESVDIECIKFIGLFILVGATIQQPSDMRYLYENFDGFSILPTFYVLYGPMGSMETSMVPESLPHAEVNVTSV